jgi:hypothetical protein
VSLRNWADLTVCRADDLLARPGDKRRIAYIYIHFYILGMYTTEDMKGAVSSDFCLGFFFTTKEHTPVPNMAFELIEYSTFKVTP